MRTAALLLLWSTMHCLALRLPWQVWRTLATPRPGTSAPGRAVDAFLAERRAAAAVARDGGEEVKALAFDADGGGSVVAVVLASDSVDPAALARSVGAGGARLAPAADVRVGFDVGSGGSGEGDRKLVLRDGPELLRLAGGRSAVIARARPGRDPAPAAVGVDATGGRATVVGVAIVGATLERAKGTEQVRNAIRRLRCGQRVVVSGTPTWADGPTRWARWREKRRQLRDGQLDFRCDELEVLGSKAPPKPRRKLSPRRAADKALPCSAWGVGARPLPDAWVAYAALDAYVCVLLHDSLADRGSDAVAALDVSAAAPRAGDLSAVDDPERTSALLGRGRQRVNHPKDDALTFVAGTDGALSGYDKRSGVVRLRDCSVFFVNWDPPKPNRRSRYFDRKYPNAMKRNGHGGLEVSWWPPRAFDESRLDAEPLLLFGRRGKAEFLFLGKLRFARPLAEDDPTATPGGLVFELLDGEALLARAADDAHYPGLGALLELGMNPDGGGS
ncbi:3'-5'-exoribonuclease [Aureococcus anophagefferens]|nr:3'-5'-exoribonuclease [Aureococcus anophagefferens]